MQSQSRKFKIIGLVASSALVGLLAGCGTNVSASTVATYNGGTISTAAMDKQINLEKLFNPTFSPTTAQKQQLITQYIVFERLLLGKAQQVGMTTTQSQVNASLVQLKKQLIAQVYKNSSSAFNTKLQSLGLTDADLSQLIHDDLLVQAYAKTLVKTIPLPTQMQYYKQHLAQYSTVTERAILVPTLAEAQKVHQLLANGGSWYTLAKQYSKDPGSSKNGGEYVNQNPTNWVAPFQEHAMTQPLHALGQPFDSTYGYFVMMVEKRTTSPFKVVQASIIQQLQQTAGNQAFTAVSNQLEKAANIKVTLPS